MGSWLKYNIFTGIKIKRQGSKYELLKFVNYFNYNLLCGREDDRTY